MEKTDISDLEKSLNSLKGAISFFRSAVANTQTNNSVSFTSEDLHGFATLLENEAVKSLGFLNKAKKKQGSSEERTKPEKMQPEKQPQDIS
jgi:hypothetical protein